MSVTQKPNFQPEGFFSAYLKKQTLISLKKQKELKKTYLASNTFFAHFNTYLKKQLMLRVQESISLHYSNYVIYKIMHLLVSCLYFCICGKKMSFFSSTTNKLGLVKTRCPRPATSLKGAKFIVRDPLAHNTKSLSISKCKSCIVTEICIRATRSRVKAVH